MIVPENRLWTQSSLQHTFVCTFCNYPYTPHVRDCTEQLAACIAHTPAGSKSHKWQSDSKFDRSTHTPSLRTFFSILFNHSFLSSLFILSWHSLIESSCLQTLQSNPCDTSLVSNSLSFPASFLLSGHKDLYIISITSQLHLCIKCALIAWGKNAFRDTIKPAISVVICLNINIKNYSGLIRLLLLKSWYWLLLCWYFTAF